MEISNNSENMEASITTDHSVTNYYQNFGALIYLNVILLAMQSFTSSGKNILYSIFADDHYTFLGPTQYMCNYFFGPLTLLFVDTLINRFRFNFLFFLSSFSLNLFLLGGLLVTYCQFEGNPDTVFCSSASIISVSVLSTVMAGILSTLYYVSYTTYINSVSNGANKSFYYGISYSLNSSSSIFANLLGYFLIGQFSNYKFYLYIVIISIGVQLLFVFVRDKRPRNLHTPRPVGENIIYQFTSIKDEIIGERFRKLMVYLCFAGMMNSVVYLYYPVMIDHSLGPQVTSSQKEKSQYIVYLVSGIGQIMGGTVGGKLCEYIQRTKTAYLALFLILIGNTFSLLSFIFQSFVLACIASFFFGLGDTSTSAVGLSIMTKEISRSNHAFAAFNLCQSLGFGVPSIFWAIFNDRIFYWDLGFVYFSVMMAAFSVWYYRKWVGSETEIEGVLTNKLLKTYSRD